MKPIDDERIPGYEGPDVIPGSHLCGGPFEGLEGDHLMAVDRAVNFLTGGAGSPREMTVREFGAELANLQAVRDAVRDAVLDTGAELRTDPDDDRSEADKRRDDSISF